jgi:hypothetical protein
MVTSIGPLSSALAARYLAAHWGLSRLTANVQQRVDHIAVQARIRLVTHAGEVFLWPAHLDPADYRGFRIPGGSPNARQNATDLPPEEIANAAQHLLSRHISLPMDALGRETGRLFGYQRTGQRLEQAIQRGLAILIQRQGAREQDGIVLSSTVGSL